MARKYTEAVHAARLLGMLKRKDPCLCCPAQIRYKKHGFMINGADLFVEEEIIFPRLVRVGCQVCRNFINEKDSIQCPCDHYGKEEALKRTWEALEAKGYI